MLCCFPFILDTTHEALRISKEVPEWRNREVNQQVWGAYVWNIFPPPPLSHHCPTVFQCTPNILLAGTGREEGQNVSSRGEEGKLLRCPLLSCTHPKYGLWALPQSLESLLVSQMLFREYYEYSFHSLSRSAQRKAKTRNWNWYRSWDKMKLNRPRGMIHDSSWIPNGKHYCWFLFLSILFSLISLIFLC